MDPIKDFEVITRDAIKFTKIHIKETIEKGDKHVATLLFLHGMKKPYLDLLAYTNAFCEGISYSNFYKKYNRFPTKEELNEINQIRKDMLEELGPLIVNYEIKGNVNII